MKTNEELKNINQKFNSLKKLLEHDLRNDNLADKTTIYAFSKDNQDLYELFTKKRIEIINAIRKYKPKNIKDLANHLNRKIPAVHRDIHILLKYGIIELIKTKEGLIPKLVKQAITLKLDVEEPSVLSIYFTNFPHFKGKSELKQCMRILNKLTTEEVDNLLEKKEFRILLMNCIHNLNYSCYFFNREDYNKLMDGITDNKIKKELKNMIIGEE